MNGEGPYCIEYRFIGGMSELFGWDRWIVYRRFWSEEARDEYLADLQKKRRRKEPVAEFRPKDES